MRHGARRALRIAIGLGCALCCLPALLFSVLAVMATLSALLRTPVTHALSDKVVLGGIGLVLAWLSLAVLAWAWLHRRSASLLWAATGSVCGLACLLLYIPFSVLALPPFAFGLTLIAQQWTRRLR